MLGRRWVVEHIACIHPPHDKLIPSPAHSPRHAHSQASDSITKIATVLTEPQIQAHYLPLLKRLSGGDWFTSRTSAASLFAAIYGKVGTSTQDEMRKMFGALCNDDTPMVRRAAARDLGVSRGANAYRQRYRQRLGLLTVHAPTRTPGFCKRALPLVRNRGHDPPIPQAQHR